MTERLKVTVLKTVVVKATVGSNPTPSAGHLKKIEYWGGARVADWARLLSECRGFKPRPRVQIPPSPLEKTPLARVFFYLAWVPIEGMTFKSRPPR